MNTLQNKKILFCRSREQSEAFEKTFLSAGANVDFFAVSQTHLLDVTKNGEITTAIKNLAGFDWIIFSSAMGVESFWSALETLDSNSDFPAKLNIATVGTKAANCLQQFSSTLNVSLQRADLQSLIEAIPFRHSAIKVLHPTSVQSLENIHLRVPEGIILHRLPLYETIVNPEITNAEIAMICAENFDVIVFSSPSSFEHFIDLCGEDGMWRNAAIATFGKTTRRHIEPLGYAVSIVPEAPTPAALKKSLTAFFKKNVSESAIVKQIKTGVNIHRDS